MAQEFGQAVLIVAADDKQLQDTLKRDEQLVRASTDRMQASLDTLQVSTAETSSASEEAAAAMTALGAAAILTGSRVLVSAGRMVAMALAARGAGTAVLAAAAKFRVMGAASMAFLVTPLGLAVAAAAAAALAIAYVWKTNRDEQREAAEALKTLEDRLRGVTEARKEELKVLQRRVDILKGRYGKYEHLHPKVAALKEEEDVLIAARAAADADERRAKATLERVNLLYDEIDVLSGIKTKYDLIANAEERIATFERDRLLHHKQLADELAREAKAREAARKARIAAEGPQTEVAARQFILDTLKFVQLGLNAQRLLLTQFTSVVRTFGLTKAEAEELARRIGLAGILTAKDTDKGRMAFGPGAMRLAAFAGTGAGRMAGVSSVEQKRARQEDERTKAAKETARQTKRAADFLAISSSGAR